MNLRPLVIPSIALALLAGCTDDPPATPGAVAPAASVAPPVEVTESLDVPPTDIGSVTARPEAGGEGAPGQRSQMTASGTGPFQVDEVQAEIVDAGILTGAVAANGCATGTVFFGTPKVRFAGGKLVEVRTTEATAKTAAGVAIGAALAQVQAAYPTGKALAGPAGVTGWEVVEETNALLIELTGDKVTALTAGVAATVEQNFTAGQPC